MAGFRTYKRTFRTKTPYARQRAASAGRRTSAIALARANARKLANMRTGGFEGMENKFVDYQNDAATLSLTWAGGELNPATPGCLSAVAQGDGESQRDGRVYHINSIHLRGYVEAPNAESQTAPLKDQLVRLCLVWDTQTNGATLNAEDVMAAIGSGDDFFSFRNLQYSKRFIVLKDMTIRIPASAAGMNEGASNLFAQANCKVPFKINKKFSKPIKVRCTGTTATVASISDNSLHLIGCCSENVNTATISFESRVRFSG